MKWKNFDIGAAYYYITGTFTEWLPLFKNAEVRSIVRDEITHALSECNACISAFVIMPDHLHMLVYLPDSKLLHRFNKLWRGRSARKSHSMPSSEARLRYWILWLAMPMVTAAMPFGKNRCGHFLSTAKRNCMPW